MSTTTTEQAVSGIIRQRFRNIKRNIAINETNENHIIITPITNSPNDDTDTNNSTNNLNNSYTNNNNYYYISKWIIIRLTGFIYVTGFTVALFQNVALFGHENSIQPVGPAIEHVLLQYQNNYSNTKNDFLLWRFYGFMKHPMIFWFYGVPFNYTNLYIVTYTGLVLSLFQFFGCTSWIIQSVCWLFYFTIVSTAELSGTSFYGYGWESQILETGFLTIFLCTLPHFYIANTKNYDTNNTNRKRYKFTLSLYESSNNSNLIRSCRSNNVPSTIILWLYQWLSFRIAIGAGLIKIRGSSCWTNKTCLYYHFETQPIPSPMSWIYHFLPKFIQVQLVNTDLVVQLYTAWFVLFPPVYSAITRFIIIRCIQPYSTVLAKRIVQIQLLFLRSGGILQIGLMIGILCSGNFSVLNWLTIIPAVACFDDNIYPQWLQQYLIPPPVTNSSTSTKNQYQHKKNDDDNIATSNENCGTNNNSTNTSQYQHKKEHDELTSNPYIPLSRRTIDLLLFVLIMFLSKPVIDNLFLWNNKKQQMMNASYDPFRLVNTYGAFGSVGTARYEVIIQVSFDNGMNWIELEFPCKPGNLDRRPCFCAPYHYRVDWNIWFIGFKPHEYYLRNRERWLYNLLYKLVDTTTNDPSSSKPWLDVFDTSTTKLLNEAYNSSTSNKRLYAKVDMYHYRMTQPLWSIIWEYLTNSNDNKSIRQIVNGYERGIWWERKLEQSLVPVVTVDPEYHRLVVVQ